MTYDTVKSGAHACIVRVRHTDAVKITDIEKEIPLDLTPKVK